MNLLYRSLPLCRHGDASKDDSHQTSSSPMDTIMGSGTSDTRGTTPPLCGYKFRVRELVRNRTRAPVITGWGGYWNRLTDWITTGSRQVKMAPVLSPRAGNRSGGLVLPVIRAGEPVLNSGFKPVRRTGFYEYRTNCI